jgi:hypothetical protein
MQHSAIIPASLLPCRKIDFLLTDACLNALWLNKGMNGIL